MLNDKIKVTGKLNIIVFDTNGNIKTQRGHKNLVVTSGKNWIASRLKDSGQPTEMNYIALGTGTGAANVANTTLATELVRISTSSIVVANNTITYTTTFNPTVGTGALTEAGIFNAASNGTMLCRTVFPVINKGASDTVAVTWEITIN